MENENSEGKWAREVYDTLRIFRRISHTLYGLLLVEIGWVLLLVLVTKLSPSGGDNPPPAIVTIPWFFPLTINVGDLFVPGAVILALLWVIWSRLINYFWLPLRNMLRTIFVLLLHVLIILAVLFNVPLLLISYPLERKKAKRWIAQLGTADEEALRKRLARLADEDEGRLKEFLNKRDRSSVEGKYGWSVAKLLFKVDGHTPEDWARLRAMLEKRERYRAAVAGTKISRWIVAERLVILIQKRIKWLASRTYVAFAPLRSFSYEEDLNSSKAPAQVFSFATDRMGWHLRNFKLIRHFIFHHLPEHWSPRNASEAALLRKTLGLDVLLWGSYLPGSTTSIWLNIQQELPRNTENDDEERVRPLEDLFPLVFHTHYSMLVIDQRAPLDPYIALIIAVIQTLEGRQSLGNRLLARLLGGRFGDELRYSSTQVSKLIEYLVFDAFPHLGVSSCSLVDDYPSPRRVLVEIVGKWVGHTMESGWLDSDARSMVEDHTAVLGQMLQKCIELEPSIPENYYRYGAVACLLSLPQKAIRAFSDAKKYESVRDVKTSYIVGAMAELSLSPTKTLWEAIPLAQYAAYAARSINMGTSWTKKSLASNLAKTNFHRARAQHAETALSEGTEEASSWTVIDYLLSESYPPGPTSH